MDMDNWREHERKAAQEPGATLREVGLGQWLLFAVIIAFLVIVTWMVLWAADKIAWWSTRCEDWLVWRLIYK